MTAVAAKRFLVTGGAGFIGSAVVRQLIANTPHRVTVVDKLTYAGGLDSLASVTGNARFEFIRGDIAEQQQMADLVEAVRPDIVLHLAAETHVDRSIANAAEFVQSNIVGTFALLQATLGYWRKLPSAKQHAFRFHHVSTDEVFGPLEGEGAFDETSPYRPSSPYAASKAASDHLVRVWHRTYGLPVVLSNCGNNYGPYQFPEKLIPLMILNCLEGRELPVYGRGDAIREWLYVEDHARALILVAEAGRIGETYLVGGGETKTNLAVVQTICALADRRAPRGGLGKRERLIRFVADRPGHDHRYSIDAAKIRDELGWRPAETFETGIEKTFEWYLANRTWWTRIRSGIYEGERLGLVS